MGLVHIVDREGREHLVHTSQLEFRRPRWVSPAEREAMWQTVWRRMDAVDGQVFSPLAIDP